MTEPGVAILPQEDAGDSLTDALAAGLHPCVCVQSVEELKQKMQEQNTTEDINEQERAKFNNYTKVGVWVLF